MSGSLDPFRLARLDAGLGDPREAAVERARAATDPAAGAVLDALAATRAELAALPCPALPPAVHARISDALDAVDTARVTRRRRPAARRRLRAAAATLVGLAAASIAVALAGPARVSTPVLALHADELAAAAPVSLGATDLGPLADADRRAECLGAAGVLGPHEPVLGGRPVLLDGRPGTLLVLPTGTLGSFRVVVVDRDCGPAGGTLLAEHTVPR
ncbi:hypothetical protein ACFQE5_18030 [Pseudonocardia hispaniensis]|uniref:Anti-sigma-M factor RsmA n=1 Tax=Pseudonocardia hispaniensis TaxID=904933 RepID=A0ABW1J5I7_9PSEU